MKTLLIVAAIIVFLVHGFVMYCCIKVGAESEKNYDELKANRFAAEFLLPTEKLEIEIKGENSGDIKLVELSAILYAVWTIAGSIFNFKNIGINTGAIIAHLAEADPINKFITAVININPIRSGIVPIFADSNIDAPVTAIIVPKLV